MCPVCWATVLAAFSMYLGVTAAVLLWRDWPSLILALALLILAAFHSEALVAISWASFAAIGLTLVLRVAWVLVVHGERVALWGAWRRAQAIAAKRCANRNQAPAQLSVDSLATSTTDRRRR